jgi:formylglycine-generating enzyme required for sulfatase activity
VVDVFISYRRTQRSKVEPIKDRLEALGLKVFFDVHGIDGGADFPTVIDANLRAAKVVLACWSPAYFERRPPPDWCMVECRFGMKQQKLVPIAIERFDADEPPADMHGANYFDLTAWRGHDQHEDWRRTLGTLSRHLGRDLAAGAPGSATSQTRPPPTPVTPPPATPKRDDRSRPGAVWRDAIPGLSESACPEMVTIPSGKFLMGAPPGEERSSDVERPQHEVRIDYAFALGKHAVTFAEWDAAIAAGAKLEKPGDQGWGRDRRPVINVNWNDAKAYIAWLNSKLGLEGRADAYRLPSEAEWEYACRAGTTTPFSFGATISTAQANYDGNSTYGAGKKGEYRQKTTLVGSFPANSFGLHDMHGNVREWCEDVWNANYNGAPTDGSAWLTGDTSSRVLRGGSWNNNPIRLRSANRNWGNPTYPNNYIGFRVARIV